MAKNHGESPLFTAEVPSNIALVKYWGKRDSEQQWPANDSLSMTLSAARTITTAAPTSGPDTIERVVQAQAPAVVAAGNDKAARHLQVLKRLLGFQQNLHIHTHNTFPTGCGIASSASGLGALTVAAIAAWTGAGSLAELAAADFPRERLGHLARLGSGSAGRSMFGGFVAWSAGDEPRAQRLAPLACDWQLSDIIVLVSSREKPVSSSEGHASAWSSPLFTPRLAGLPARLARVRQALATQNLAELGAELEAEALDMHAVMLSGEPRLNYLLPSTAEVLVWLRRERDATGLAAYFTLDAGPNVHILCAPHTASELVQRLTTAFPNYPLIVDRTGQGPLLHKGINQ